jgi:hypothetical protein
MITTITHPMTDWEEYRQYAKLNSFGASPERIKTKHLKKY